MIFTSAAACDADYRGVSAAATVAASVAALGPATFTASANAEERGDVEAKLVGTTDTSKSLVVDGVGNEVYRHRPGDNGRFDGIAPNSDDKVRHFDVGHDGARGPEGIAYDTANAPKTPREYR